MNRVFLLAALSLSIIWSTGCQTIGGRTMSPVAVSGLSLKLAHITNLNPDCSLIGEQPVVRVLRNPEHGHVTVSSGQGYSTYARENPRHQCDFRPSSGVNIVYVSNSGYVGPDSVAVDAFGGGQEGQLTFNLTVK
jgi:hypothetical protein